VALRFGVVGTAMLRTMIGDRAAPQHVVAEHAGFGDGGGAGRGADDGAPAEATLLLDDSRCCRLLLGVGFLFGDEISLEGLAILLGDLLASLDEGIDGALTRRHSCCIFTGKIGSAG
jgi:hypothetical protein